MKVSDGGVNRSISSSGMILFAKEILDQGTDQQNANEAAFIQYIPYFCMIACYDFRNKPIICGKNKKE